MIVRLWLADLCAWLARRRLGQAERWQARADWLRGAPAVLPAVTLEQKAREAGL